MVTSPPPLLLLLLALAGASALALAWIIRADWSIRGRLQPWRLIEGVLGLFLVLAMLFATTIQVLARYALADLVTVPWTEELARLLLVWAAFWGAAILQRSDDHISMTVVFDWLPPAAKLAVRLLGDLITLALLALVAWHGWRTALRQLVMSTVSLGLPISVFIVPVALGATLMIVHTVGIMVRRVRGRPIHEAAPAEILMDAQPLTIVLAVFLTLFVLRVPVAFTLTAASTVGLLLSPKAIPLSTLATTMWQGINSFVLLALPFFILMGDLALASGVTQRLVACAKAFVGHITGGLAHVSVVVNMIMAGMSGSDLADAAATGGVLIPAMKRVGYPVGYAASIIAGAATIGPLIPPSIAFIIFAAATDTSVGRLFLGGAIPGVMLGLLLMAQAYVVARRHGYPREPRVPGRERLRVTVASLPVLAIPVIVLGSILAGIATPTEAAVLGVLCVLLTGGVLYRELTLAAFARQVLTTLRTTAAIFFIIATAAVFGRVLTLYGAAQALADWITGLTSDPTVFLLGVNLVYLVLGSVVDTVPILLVFVPLLMPTVQKLGIDPIHFGVITVFNLLIGLITPPYGLTMYLLCRMSDISLVEFWRYAWPIFLMMVAALGLTTFVPALTVTLPNLLMP